MEMVAQWVRWTRWRGDDERMMRVQWAWAYRHSCGIAHKWLKAPEEKDKPLKLGSKRVAVDVKSVTKIAAPESYQVLWEEHLTDKTSPTVKTQMWTGTFTVGRLALTTMDDLLDNRLGVCITAYELAPTKLEGQPYACVVPGPRRVSALRLSARGAATAADCACGGRPLDLGRA